MTSDSGTQRQELLDRVRTFARLEHTGEEFVPGETRVMVSGRTIDEEDIASLVDAALDGWLTSGRFAAQFEEELSGYLGREHAILCNSGSSANLLAVSALTSKKLGQKRLQAGDEVITVAGGFPTTVGPLIQNGLVPVFIDLEPLEAGTYNADVEMLEEAVSDRTRGVILAHTLGNPFQVDVVTKFAKDRGLWFVEDNCDALGSRFAGRLTGSFGHLATSSFYPAHHITMGEGGCVLTDRGRLKTLVESFRDWGRDCWCEPGDADTCGKRFNWKLGKLPRGYDHKYIFSHVGYNMKVTDMQAAAGVSQLKKLDRFVAARRANFDHLSKALADLEDLFVLPQATERSEPSWFGFPLSVRTDAGFDRRELVTFLDTRNIDTRMLFAGNLARQPAYQDRVFRSIGDLVQTDRVMESTFWIGVYPGLSEAMIDYVSESIHTFSRGKK